MIDWNQNMDEAPRDGTPFLGGWYDEDGDWAWDRCIWCKTPHVPLSGFHATQGDPEYWDLVPLTHWAPINAPEDKNDETPNP
jgi:hypothetical protein